MTQPAAIAMAPRPAAGAIGCPPGLEYLTQVDQLLVHQDVDMLEAFVGWEVANKYSVKNSMGQQVYKAAEESETCQRQCCTNDRGFVMHITDNNGQEVIRVKREFKCCAGCSWCANSPTCAMTCDIEAPVGTVIGSVVQTQSYCAKKFVIKDSIGQTMFHVQGPACICQAPCCPNDVDFNIYTADKRATIGRIAKQWSGLAKEMFTKADNFGVTFPMDLDVKMKATLLGAVFLIDFMFFEDDDDDDN